MKTLLIIFSILCISLPVQAAEEGLCFVYGYSYNPKKAYFSNIFAVKVKGKSYSDTEYVADVELIMDIEEKFREALFEIESLVTVIVLGPYKTKEIAKKHLDDERDNFRIKKFEIVDLGFNFRQ